MDERFMALAEAIARQDLVPTCPSGESIPFLDLVSIDATVQSIGSSPLHHAIHATLLRLAETSILSHPRLQKLSEVWDGILGDAEVRIRNNLKLILGVDPPDPLVRHVYRCLGGSAAQRGKQKGRHADHFPALLERCIETNGAGCDVRCFCCGYHFRQKDLSEEKRRLALEAGVVLSKQLFPGRNSDSFKPLMKGDQHSWTGLTIDHLIPEETLGWSWPDNLELACAFCNEGKLAFRRPLEALSLFAVGGLTHTHGANRFGPLKHQIVVATLRSHAGRCGLCQATVGERELTVRPVEDIGNERLGGFAPWNLMTVCYQCAGGLPETDDGVEHELGDDRSSQPDS